MELIVNIISGIFIFIGSVFMVGGAIGLIRMPDFYTRLHAASVTDTGGILFIMIGLVLQALFIFDNPMAAIKLVLVVVFIYFTAPTASHAVAKAALMAKIIPKCPNGRLAVDESLTELHSAAQMLQDKNKKTVIKGSAS
ncbi:MAG: multicomponent Na+:H+ antiporter subunit G [Cellvibrionaceae bacterium]|jgi:multicomponent Na+:H+ antiporter subunit G